MLKDYKTRVNATYQMLYETLVIMNREYSGLISLIKKADEFTASDGFRKQELPVNYMPSSDSVMVEFKGYEYEVVKSDLTGGDWIKYSHTPKTYRIPYFYKPKVAASVKLPEAYIIPAEWSEIIQLISVHGIKYFTLKKETGVKVGSCRFSDIKFNNSPYEGRMKIADFGCEDVTEERVFPAGSVIVPLSQPSAKLIAYMFEPRAYDSFMNWGFFNSIFEQKEYGESYKMEVKAREMLASNPSLRAEFEKKKAEDKEFTGNFWAQLNWFYNRSEWADKRLNVYPIGKIYDKEILKNIAGLLN
jgi:hypothetical protein